MLQPTPVPDAVFDPTRLATSPAIRAALVAARPVLRRALGLTRLDRLYRGLPPSHPEAFSDAVLQALGVTANCPAEDRQRVPPDGPLVVLANHPHGALDGLVLYSLIRRARPDVRILANRYLAAIPPLAETCFFVDPFGGRSATANSRRGLRAALRWLQSGGALIAFPAGEVAHHQLATDTPEDSDWHDTATRLACATSAAVMPARIDGRNRDLFYRVGRVHAMLRTCLLARELLGARGRTVCVRLGTPIEAGPDRDASALTCEARVAVSLLHAPASTAAANRPAGAAVVAEVAALPSDACLVTSGEFRVYCTTADRIPCTLQEIGRLREQTYRAIGEGTGGATDLDDFDRTYVHLFSWDTTHARVVGAYRLGRVDRLTADAGVEALYTRSLFRYDHRLIDRLGPALELGRAFVREEYQRNHSALLLLWKGIGRFVVTHPEYRVLFGPVSVSARYSDTSQQLLMAFLEQNHRDEGLAALVTALHPPARSPEKDAPQLASARSVDELHKRVSELERDRQGLPILIRQYLKLNAHVLAFNVDPQFGDALDALMMVDLTRVDRPILNRYLGTADAGRYLAHHAQATVDHAA